MNGEHYCYKEKNRVGTFSNLDLKEQIFMDGWMDDRSVAEQDSWEYSVE